MLLDAIFPGEKNNFTPRLLQRSAMVVMLFLIFLSFLTTNMQALFWQQSDWLVGAILPAVILKETNKARNDDDISALVRNEVLDKAAQLKAEHMATNRYFSHDSPDGVTPWHWFDEVGYTYAYAGENLAVHFTDSKDVVEAWLESPSHRANIMQGNYQEIGIGTARGRFEGFDTVFVVQLFGTPALPKKDSSNIVSNDAFGARLAPSTSTVDFFDEYASTSEFYIATSTASETPIVAGDFTVRSDFASSGVPEVSEQEVQEEVLTESAILFSEGVAVLEPVSTSTGLLPVTVTDVATSASELSEVVALTTQPSAFLQIIYVIIGFFLSILLFISVLMAWRQHSVRYVLYGVCLLLLMCALFYVHVSVTGGVVIE